MSGKTRFSSCRCVRDGRGHDQGAAFCCSFERTGSSDIGYDGCQGERSPAPDYGHRGCWSGCSRYHKRRPLYVYLANADGSPKNDAAVSPPAGGLPSDWIIHTLSVPAGFWTPCILQTMCRTFELELGDEPHSRAPSSTRFTDPLLQDPIRAADRDFIASPVGSAARSDVHSVSLFV